MVKVAIVGSNSGTAREVIDALVEGQKHEVLALVRKDPASFPKQAGVTWVQTSFQDKAELVKIFQGVGVVLNFIVVANDPGSEVAKRVVDAAVEAGVPRYAPSEWAMGQNLSKIISSVPWYQGKLDMQAYLREINKEKKVIEYTFFQPGMFLEYIANPHQIAKHLTPMPTVWDVNGGRVVAVRGHENDLLSATSVRDIANIVRLAIEYEGAWPEIGGIRGVNLSTLQFKKIVESLGALPAGKTEMAIEYAEEEDIKKGVLNVYMPVITHPSIPEEARQAWHAPGWTGFLSSVSGGGWSVTDEWNKLLPDYKFRTVEEVILESIKKD